MMTSNKIYLFIAVAGTLLFGSCNRQEEDLFDKSASERMDAATKNASDVLTAAPNGWEMHYYTNTNGQGNVLLFKFEKNGVVTVAAKNATSSNNGVYKTAQSIWAMDATQGPVLSMKTYNDVFSIFADPQNDGLGEEGDYEFIVLSATSEKVELMGKKHRALCSMTPVDASQSWETFFGPIDEIKQYVFNGNDGMQFQLVVDDKVFLPLEYYSYMQMVDAVQYAYVFPVLVTRTGVEFYGNGIYTPDSVYAKHFVLNDARTRLVCTDPGVNAYIKSAYSIRDYFNFRLLKNNEWQVSASGHGSTSQAAYDAFSKSIKNTNATLNYMAFTLLQDSTLALHIRFTVSNKRYDGYCQLTMELGTTEDALTIAYVSADANATAALKRAGGNDQTKGEDMLKAIIAGNFTMKSVSGSTLNIQEMYLQDGADPERKLKIVVK